MVRRLNLNERLDSAAAEVLCADLAAADGEDLTLDASKVQVLGGRCLELLMCARQVWEGAGHALTIENASDQFADNLARFGLTSDALSTGGPV